MKRALERPEPFESTENAESLRNRAYLSGRSRENRLEGSLLKFRPGGYSAVNSGGPTSILTNNGEKTTILEENYGTLILAEKLNKKINGTQS